MSDLHPNFHSLRSEFLVLVLGPKFVQRPPKYPPPDIRAEERINFGHGVRGTKPFLADIRRAAYGFCSGLILCLDRHDRQINRVGSLKSILYTVHQGGGGGRWPSDGGGG